MRWLLLLLLTGCATVDPIVCETEIVKVTRWKVQPVSPDLLTDRGRPDADVSTNGGLHQYALQCNNILDLHVCDKRVIAGEYDTIEDCIDD